MSRLHDLLRQVANSDPQLAKDLQRETDALANRRSFGLHFERHTPEAVELPGRLVRKNDKVRCLPERGKMPTKKNEKLYRVTDLYSEDGQPCADIVAMDAPEDRLSIAVEDLVVVAEFRDPIYPGLVSTGRVERGGDKPFHAVINAENYHALQALLFTHRGKVDAIYVDPPYNTGAKDWKYNNDYVESDDHYRHSKWLAFMERRLLLAKELLNPDDSVLVVTIDEKEYLRLGLLLEQTFPDGNIEMVTSVISAKGVARFGQFSRVEEYVFTVRFGDQKVGLGESNMLDESRSASAKVGKPVDWLGLRRREPTARRGARPKQFYPVFVSISTGHLHSVGDFITNDVDRNSVAIPPGTFAVWPLLPDGTEGLWGITPETARTYLEHGYLRARNAKPSEKRAAIQYLTSGTVAAIASGDIEFEGRAEDGSVIARYKSAKGVIPKRVWNVASHNAESGGTKLLSALIPGRRFPFPKSLFAVEDVLRFFVSEKLDATIVDFFSGSGTTAHAVMRLNKQDGGRRRSISITNNEVSADEQRKLRDEGLRPGDVEWEQWGICDYITKPRIKAAITGCAPDGKPVKGAYKFTDEFPMGDGFEENFEFFTLTYESAMRVSSHREFPKIAAFLWLRAGSRGRRIDNIFTGWDVAEAYGVIANLDLSEPFLKAVEAEAGLTHAFIVTDEDRLFEAMVRRLPEHVEPVRLYSSYLRNFEIEAWRAAR
ncbi:site-specific DNA-methyltransferase [Actinomadura coerulea]|uniref:site-specific DNA-methyltransferase n=1 Tax=Actinomadura coerulea TaxID=46159 RepID=UPI00342B30D5